MTINILILSVGRRVELVKLFKEASRKFSIVSKIVAVDCSNTAPGLYFADRHYLIPRIKDDNYLDSLINICNQENIALIVPTIDTELIKLSDNKDYLENNTKAKVLISSPDCINICRDKTKTYNFFMENKFNCPRTLSKKEINNQEYQFPLFIKPKNGSSSINAFKVNSQCELEFFLSYIKEPIVQEFIDGTEYTIDVLTDFESNVISIVPRIRLAVRSGEILKGKIEKNELIIEDVKRLVKCLKPIGPITVQCIVTDSNEINYIEINPRFGGGAPMSIKAGANSCLALYRLLLGEKVEYTEDYRDNITFSRYDDSLLIENKDD